MGISTSIQVVTGFRSNMIFRVSMINPPFPTDTLVKRNATLPFSQHKFIPTCMSVQMLFKFVKTMEVLFTKLAGKRSQQSNFHFYNVLFFYRFLLALDLKVTLTALESCNLTPLLLSGNGDIMMGCL